MKKLLLSITIFIATNCLAQQAEVTCGSPYPKLNYGYVNYKDYQLGRVIKITYETNLWGHRAKITNIEGIGAVITKSVNITTSTTADSIITIIGSSSAVNINLNGVLPKAASTSVTASIINEVANNLAVLMLGETTTSINNINALKDSIKKLSLPDVSKQKKTVYAIINEVQVANKLVIGLKKGNNFSLDLSVDVPTTISATGKISVNISCTDITTFKGANKLAFYNFTPIDNQGNILSEFANVKFQTFTLKDEKFDYLMDEKSGNLFVKNPDKEEKSKKIIFVDKLPIEKK